MRAAIAAANGGSLLHRALSNPALLDAIRRAVAVHILAVGKASAAMVRACSVLDVAIRTVAAVGIGDPGVGPDEAEWLEASHPVPDERSLLAARRAFEIARGTAPQELLLLLLSGGASSLMALPAPGLPLADKQRVIRMLLDQGASIRELNTVRKHLSAVKGGRLATACAGRIITLAISDVVGDDLSIIGSGPAVTDPSTPGMALAVMERYGGPGAYPPSAVERLRRGAAGGFGDAPKPGDPGLARAEGWVIGGRADAIRGARLAAESLGYHVSIVEEPIEGNATDAARKHLALVASVSASTPRPLCVLSAGETTVKVTGDGRGGRNQEFALVLASGLAMFGTDVAAASVGTDGIDGPTDAAGAVVDVTTRLRADRIGLGPPEHYLQNNDTYSYFASLDDLIRTGPTGTNVGDVQVVLIL